MQEFQQSEVGLPESHHGLWSGPNRLWVTDPTKPFRSAGTLTVAERTIDYTWSHEGKDHTGKVTITGQPTALAAAWTDSWHAADGMTMHGFMDAGVLRVFGTYDAGEAAWGWQFEVDCRDPEACTLRMFNVIPGMGPVPAVVLAGVR